MKLLFTKYRVTVLSLLIIVAMFMIVQVYHGPDGFKEWTQSSAVAKAAVGGSTGQAQIGGPFEMVDHTGQTVTEALLEGKFSLIFFGFTYCPDICPLTLTKVSELYDSLSPEMQAKLQPILVSVDPARDTPEVLAEYVGAFGPQFIGLTGSAEQVQQMAKNYLVYYAQRGEGENYLVDHSGFLYLMDPAGNYLTHLKHHDDVATWRETIQQALYK